MSRQMSDASLEGRVFLITGAGSGIGAVTARELARRGARLFLAGRSRERTQTVLDDIARDTGRPATFVTLDLGDLQSVEACAKEVLASTEHLHGLINNAGLGGQRGVTQDGFEVAFGVNHLGHFRLTMLLLDRLRASAPARIVNVASLAHFQARGIDFASLRRPTRSLTALPEYSVSKLCNVLFTRELARRLAGTGVTAYAVHPGVVATDLWRSRWKIVRLVAGAFMVSPEKGARTTLWCATAPELDGISGRYYAKSRETKISSVALDDDLARRLWDESEYFVSTPRSEDRA